LYDLAEKLALHIWMREGGTQHFDYLHSWWKIYAYLVNKEQASEEEGVGTLQWKLKMENRKNN